MVTAKMATINVKTGKVTLTDYEKDITPPIIPKGVNLNKLKQVLLDKGLITDVAELE